MALQTALATDRAKGGSSKARQEPRGDDILTVTTVLCSWRRATMDRGIAPPPTSVFVSAPDFASKSVAVSTPGTETDRRRRSSATTSPDGGCHLIITRCE